MWEGGFSYIWGNIGGCYLEAEGCVRLMDRFTQDPDSFLDGGSSSCFDEGLLWE